MNPKYAEDSSTTPDTSRREFLAAVVGTRLPRFSPTPPGLSLDHGAPASKQPRFRPKEDYHA